MRSSLLLSKNVENKAPYHQTHLISQGFSPRQTLINHLTPSFFEKYSYPFNFVHSESCPNRPKFIMFSQAIQTHVILGAITMIIFLVQTSIRNIYLIKISINVVGSIRKNQSSSILKPPVVYLFQTSTPGNKSDGVPIPFCSKNI